MTDATIVLFQYGLAGVVIFGLTIAVVYLAKENRRLHEARYQDAKEVVGKITEPLESIAQYTKLTYNKLESSKRGR